MTKAKNLMLHMVAGFPTMDKSIEIAKALIESGCKYLEVQFPFLDPIADGPTIKNACQVAVEMGMNYQNFFNVLKQLNEFILQNDHKCELIIMSYYNPIFRYNEFFENFFLECKKLGIKKFIIPDMPYGQEYLDFEIIPVVSAIMDISQFTKQRFKSELIYCLGGFGVTGETNMDIAAISDYVTKLKKLTGKKVALGFGIKSKQEVESVLRFSDYAVIGSQLIREYQKSGIESLNKFVLSL